MELVNFIGANPSQDGKWLLVTFARKGSDEKFRWIVPYEAKRGPIARVAEDGKNYVYFPMKKEEHKEEPKEDEDIPF